MGIKSTLKSLNPAAAGVVAVAFSGLFAALAGYLVIVVGVFYCMFTRGYEKWEPFLNRLGLFVALPLALLIFVWLFRRSYRWCQSEA
ncbi:MAG: hypothetical protein ABIP81_02180 [Terriglobales bacterium]